jgi:putative SOS response-associated peptidase YedK
VQRSRTGAVAHVCSTSANYIAVMCGRAIQGSAPLRYAIVDGMNVRDSRVHNYPPRWNGAPSQDLLVIRRNHKTGEVSLEPLRWITPIASAGRSPAIKMASAVQKSGPSRASRKNISRARAAAPICASVGVT